MIAETKILNHCGAEVVERDAVFEVVTPEPTETHFPVAHSTFLTSVEDALDQGGFNVVGQEHSLSHEGKRYFGLIHLSSQGKENDYNWLLGLRNSDDKAFSAGIVAGNRVFVCDNLAFTGEIKVARKHTKNVLRDFRQLTCRAIGQLGDMFMKTDRRIEAYKGHDMDDRDAAKFILDACTKYRCSTPSKVDKIWTEWQEPSHEEFQPRTAWSLFNSFTEVAKGAHPTTQGQRTEALYGFTDSVVGVKFN